MAPRSLTSGARAIYSSLLRVHEAARSGHAPAMRCTFDAILDRAASRGSLAVIAALARESVGLLTSRTASDPCPPRTPLMRNISQDVRFALRTFKRRPAFTAAVVTTLALGIGANAAIFSVANAVLFQRLPFKDPSRLVMVWEDASSLGFPRNTPAPGNYTDWTTIPAFDGIAALAQTDYNLLGSGEPEHFGGAQVSSTLFDVLGVKPLLGRVWRPDEEVPGNRLAILSYAVWKRRFNSDPGIIERAVNLSGAPYTIVGVMPEGFEVVDPDYQILTPLAFSAARRNDRGAHYLEVVARLRSGVSLTQANAALGSLAERLGREHPDSNKNVGMYAVPMLDDYIGDTRTALVALIVAVGCVLLISCVNVANLMLTHAAGRTREMAVRAALGADRRRLIRQLLTESLLLAFAGGVLGVIIAAQSFSWLALLIPHALSGLSKVGLDVRVLLATAGISILTGLLFGLAPAWRASHVDPARGAARSTRGVLGTGTRLRSGLVVTEIALATMVLVAAGLLGQSLRAAQSVPLGFDPSGVLTLQLNLPRRAFAEPEKRTDFVDAVIERVRPLPGVSAAGITSAVPLSWKGGTGGFIPEGLPRDASLPYDANDRTASPGYMEAMGLTLRAGRFFDSRDSSTGAPVGIINETMARIYWPHVDPLGRRFRLDAGDTPWRTIVGIVADTRVMGIDQPPRAEMYFPIAQSSDNWMWPRDLVIKATGDPHALVRAVSEVVWAVNRDQPVSKVSTMDEIVARELQDRRLQTTLMSAFGGLALFLAAVGIYGVLSFMVSERTAEIGVRLALGGRPSQIRSRFVVRGLTLAAVGIGAGLIAAFWSSALVNRLLFNVGSRDWRTFGVQAAVIAIVTIAAAYLPARRASQIDPVTALK